MDNNFYLSPKYCLHNNVAIAEQKGAAIKFIMLDLGNEFVKDALRQSFTSYLNGLKSVGHLLDDAECGARIFFEQASYDEVRNQIARFFDIPETLPDEDAGFIVGEVEDTGIDVGADISAAEILLDTVLAEAVKKSASDIHIENSCVRFRSSGKLFNMMALAESQCRDLVARIKFLARMNMNKTGNADYGNFVHGLDENIFVRVSCVPTANNSAGGQRESVVLRILDLKRVPISINKLGLHAEQRALLETLCAHEDGLVLVCGASCSGKSTTAAALLMEIHKMSGGCKKIISMEEPPEYILPGVTQIMLGTAGDALSKMSSHVFRQDPDVIFMGEIHDKISAEAALRASLAGHLVLATLHTDSVSGSVVMFRNFGVDTSLLLSVLKGVISQHLMYVDEAAVLVADVAVPPADFQPTSIGEMSADEIDKKFMHLSNSAAYLKKAIARFPQPSWKKSLRVSRSKSDRFAV